jgi:hypothetical protein
VTQSFTTVVVAVFNAVRSGAPDDENNVPTDMPASNYTPADTIPVTPDEDEHAFGTPLRISYGDALADREGLEGDVQQHRLRRNRRFCRRPRNLRIVWQRVPLVGPPASQLGHVHFGSANPMRQLPNAACHGEVDDD